jgi:hypothetical protein
VPQPLEMIGVFQRYPDASSNVYVGYDDGDSHGHTSDE